MADQVVIIVQSYNDVQLTICPNLKPDEWEDLKLYCIDRQCRLFDFAAYSEFKFEYSVRSYEDPNSTVEASYIAKELTKYFKDKQYKISFTNLPDIDKKW